MELITTWLREQRVPTRTRILKRGAHRWPFELQTSTLRGGNRGAPKEAPCSTAIRAGKFRALLETARVRDLHIPIPTKGSPGDPGQDD